MTVAPTQAAAEVDLGTAPKANQDTPADLTPSSLTKEAFQSKYPTVVASVTVQMGVTVHVHVVDNGCYISSTARARLPGVCSDAPRALLAYAGGQWISDSAKDRNLQKKVLDPCIPDFRNPGGAGFFEQASEREQGRGV